MMLSFARGIASLRSKAFFTGQTDADGELIADVTNNDGTGGPDGFLTGSDFDFYVQAFFTGGC